MKQIFILLALLLAFTMSAQENYNHNKFKQLKEELATPNVYRTGSGAPGHEYWQQKADYLIKLELDDKKQRINGSETITYTNNSPDDLEYLWVQLDQNVRAKDSESHQVRTSSIREKMSMRSLRGILPPDFDGGFKIEKVTYKDGKDLSYTIVKTMMRINLESPLKSGKTFSFNIDWWYNINDGGNYGGRSGYEYFPEDKNYMYSIAQFFPRMCQYSDIEGWQNKQFLGRGEFALSFGDYEVHITAPEDHIVASTGELQNPDDVLTEKQKDRLEKSKTAKEPVMIVTQDEAEKNEKSKASGKKTWIFKADNVRDFAFASSRKFIWDAMGVKMGDRTVMAMSYYPKEGNPLWEQYSTKAVAHTLKWYSHYTFDYPYPVAISTHAKFTGMEYPMICFNFGRPEADGTYSKRIKYGMIGVIIHEVGHNYFPMIVNSDERQWTWMDEGLNTFVQFLTEQQWERNYPHRRGPAHKIVDYMKGDKTNIMPIMSNSESIPQFGSNSYAKPATALNILRETVMGRELFDHAFKTYSQRWMFKHPSPADFFRTMEDASGIDLDWYWRGWFFTTDHVDISIDEVDIYNFNTKNPDIEKPIAKAKNDKEHITAIRNKKAIAKTQDEMDSSLRDFYSEYDPYKPNNLDKKAYKKYYDKLDDAEKELLKSGYNFNEITFSNIGGLVMPIIMEFTYTDGSTEIIRIPAEIWKMKNDKVTKVFPTKKQLQSVELDPYLETADTDRNNNFFPERQEPSRFELYKSNWSRENEMQKDKRAKKMKQ